MWKKNARGSPAAKTGRTGLTPAHQRFLIFNQGVVGTVFNFLFNGALAWFLYHSMPRVPLWGFLSIGFDTIATAFILPACTCLYAALLIPFTVKHGWLPALEIGTAPHFAQSFARCNIAVQTILCGILGLLVFAIPTIAWFLITGTMSLPFQTFLWVKAILAAFMALVVSPPIGWLVLLWQESRAEVFRSPNR